MSRITPISQHRNVFFQLDGSAGGYIPDHGTCGQDLTWRFQDGLLTIGGTGDIHSFSKPMKSR